MSYISYYERRVDDLKTENQKLKKELREMKPKLQEYNDKLKELERQKEELERQIIEEKSKTEDIRLAEYLHDALCTHNHVDTCGWHYEKWDDVNIHDNSERANYLRKANKFLKLGYSIPDVKEIVEIIKGR